MSEKVNVLISEKEVDARIQEIADQINKDYAGKEIHMICVLKGGVFFMCELAKRITVPVSLDFMSVSSYGVHLCTLLDKPDRRVAEVQVDYCCFEIPDEFVVGYGLDYAQKYRNLPYIGVVELGTE